MATQKKPSPRKPRAKAGTPPVKAAAKRAAKKPEKARQRAKMEKVVLREKAAAKPDVPFLRLLEPLPLSERYENTPAGKLQYLYDHTVVTPDWIADRLGLNRSGVWTWTKNQGRAMTLERLEQLAGMFGFPSNLWLSHVSMEEFANGVFADYNGFGIKFDRGDGGLNQSNYGISGDNSLLSLAA